MTKRQLQNDGEQLDQSLRPIKLNQRAHARLQIKIFSAISKKA